MLQLGNEIQLFVRGRARGRTGDDLHRQLTGKVPERRLIKITCFHSRDKCEDG